MKMVNLPLPAAVPRLMAPSTSFNLENSAGAVLMGTYVTMVSVPTLYASLLPQHYRPPKLVWNAMHLANTFMLSVTRKTSLYTKPSSSEYLSSPSGTSSW